MLRDTEEKPVDQSLVASLLRWGIPTALREWYPVTMTSDALETLPLKCSAQHQASATGDPRRTVSGLVPEHRILTISVQRWGPCRTPSGNQHSRTKWVGDNCRSPQSPTLRIVTGVGWSHLSGHKEQLSGGTDWTRETEWEGDGKEERWRATWGNTIG